LNVFRFERSAVMQVVEVRTWSMQKDEPCIYV
jgi:hypothetical protein